MADDPDRRSEFIGALNTEYFVLQGVSGATIAEASSRSSLYLLTLSSSLISLGFVLGLSPDVFIPFSVAVLATVFLLGWFTVFRLIDTSIENVRAVRRMVRIRRFYASISADAAEFFSVKGDDESEAATAMGVRKPRTSSFGTMASMIGAVNASVGAGVVAVVVGWLTQSTFVAIAVALPLAAAFFAIVLVVQTRRFSTELDPV